MGESWAKANCREVHALKVAMAAAVQHATARGTVPLEVCVATVEFAAAVLDAAGVNKAEAEALLATTCKAQRDRYPASYTPPQPEPQPKFRVHFGRPGAYEADERADGEEDGADV